MASSRQYDNALDRITDELRHQFRVQDMERTEAWLLLRMLDGRIPRDKAEVMARDWLRRRIERAAGEATDG